MGAEVLIANYHAPEEQNLEGIVAVLQRFGVEKIKLQKEVFDAQFYFKLLSIAPMGELERMTQYKSSVSPTAQLLTYPVLMTHDVAGYSEILVGEDQKQHLEYARDLLKKYNNRYKENLRIPVANIVGGRIKDLRSSDKKMSKSAPNGCIFLDDNSEMIKMKLAKAVTDVSGLENLSLLYQEFVGPKVPESNRALKEELADAISRRFEEGR